MTTAILVTVIVFYVIGALFTVATIGKPRKPVDPSTAVGVVIVDAVFITGLVYVLLR